jgi:hypothetical protein
LSETPENAWKNRTPAFVRGVIGLFLLMFVILCARYFYAKHGSDFVTRVEITWPFIIAMSLLIIVFQLLGGVRMKILTSMFGLTLKPVEWIGLAQMTTFFNYLPFKGGAVAGAIFLKGAHRFPYTRFLATVMASSALAVVTFSIVGTAGLIILWLWRGLFSWVILAIYLSLFGAMFVLFMRLAGWAKRVKNRALLRFLEGWGIIRTGGKRLLLLVITDLCMVLIDALRITLSFGAIGIKLSYATGLVLIPLSNIIGVASLVPGGLGVKEFMIGLLSSELGIDFTEAIFAATLDRMILLLWVLFLGPLFIALLFLYRGMPAKKT